MGTTTSARTRRRWRALVASKGEFAKKFQAAKKPLIIVGSAVSEHADGPAMYNALSKFVEKNKDKLVTPEWNGFSVLQRVRVTDYRVHIHLTDSFL